MIFRLASICLRIKLEGGRENRENYLFRAVIDAFELPRRSTILTRCEIVRACIFSMTAALWCQAVLAPIPKWRAMTLVGSPSTRARPVKGLWR
jgi:hypothetical protein